jgi:protein-tyrosine phosphatase
VVIERGVTLILDLTEEGELTPYLEHVPEGVRHVRLPVRDFSTPTREQITEALDLIDAELERGGVVYVHCWAGCGRTGVVVGCWLVRHGAPPQKALARIVETRGPGCPQTLEQRLAVLDWRPGT